MLPVDVRWTAAEKAHVLAFFAATAVLVDEPLPGLAVPQLEAALLPPLVTVDRPHYRQMVLIIPGSAQDREQV